MRVTSASLAVSRRLVNAALTSLRGLVCAGDWCATWALAGHGVLREGEYFVQVETPGSGRVPLDRFYAGGMDNSSWLFLESVPCLL